MHFPHPLCHLIGAGASAVDQFLAAGIVTRPERQVVLTEEILIVEPYLFQARPRPGARL
jgi:hypothetical protein